MMKNALNIAAIFLIAMFFMRGPMGQDLDDVFSATFAFAIAIVIWSGVSWLGKTFADQVRSQASAKTKTDRVTDLQIDMHEMRKNLADLREQIADLTITLHDLK